MYGTESDPFILKKVPSYKKIGNEIWVERFCIYTLIKTCLLLCQITPRIGVKLVC